jgi:NAD(P)-dependent dehydrogenase (short-subunit alcohol dehydrogenase family)
VVSGSASGIGAATTKLLRDRGDTVVGIDLRDAEVCADLSSREGRASAVELALDRTAGAVDAVVLCAGMSGVDPRLVSVNFFGATALLEGLRPALAASAAPRAAVVASMTVVHPVDAELVEACVAADEAAALEVANRTIAQGRERQLYPSSKAALVRWIRGTCLQEGWADQGIALNAVAPGVVLTPMAQELFDDPKMVAAMDAAVPMPLNGHARPEVVAYALAWLVSPENTHVTGQLLYVDGGAEVTVRGPDRF